MDPNYLAYLLRFQRGARQKPWRVTLKNVQTGEVLHFPSEQKLLLHLIQVLREDENQYDPDEPSVSSLE